MSRWRVFAVLTLFTLPVLLIAGAGVIALWNSDWWIWLCWIPPVCFLAGYALLRFRPARGEAVLTDDESLPPHWTTRDEEAFQIVRREQLSASEIPVSRLSDPHFYLQAALDLSEKIAKHYHPKSSDPISSLTVLEVLAATQLSAEETAAWFEGNVPGSHLLTISHWRMLSETPRWISMASDAAWLISVWWNPTNLPRWLASRYATGSASEELEASLLAAFYREYLHNVGVYCVEMNSGRLRGGVARYRLAMEQLQRESPGDRPLPGTFRRRHANTDMVRAGSGMSAPMPSEADDSDKTPGVVRIAVVGQVNAGKSSLINSVLGEQRAKTDVLAATDAIDTYRYIIPSGGQKVELLDTPGYGSSELTKGQRTAIETAWSTSDLVLLVMDASSPARQADWRTLMELSDWYAAQPHLKPPPVLGVLTHIDRLSPVMEWQPPYDWQKPSSAKEKSIRAAMEYAEKVFGEKLDAVIPVCSDSAHGRTYGIHEWLLPALLATLSEAKASLIVRSLHRDTDSEAIRQLVRQFRGAGMSILRSLVKS